MALVIPSGFAQVAVQYSVGGDSERMVTTFGIEIPFNSDYQLFADDLSTDWTNTLGLPAAWSNQYTYRGLVLRIGTGGPDHVVIENPETVIGTATDPPIPTNCAMLIRKQTSRGGRTGRGRMYLPPGGLYDATVDHNGIIGDTHRAGWQTRATNFLAAAPPLVLLHDSTAPGGSTPTPITGLQVDARIATQRRRMRS